MKAETVGEDLRVRGNVFQRVGPKTLNDPSPICLLLLVGISGFVNRKGRGGDVNFR